MKLLKMLAVVVLAAMMLGASCRGPVTPPPIAVEPNDTENCPAACENLRKLGCPEGEPLENGTTCEKFCEDTQKAGHGLNPTCVMAMTECSGLAACTNPRK